MAATRAKTIWISKGRASYVGGTITAAEDISTATLLIGLSTSRDEPPALNAMVTPDITTEGATGAVQEILLTVNLATATTFGFEAGDDVYCWGNVADNPENEPVLFDRLIHLL